MSQTGKENDDQCIAGGGGVVEGYSIPMPLTKIIHLISSLCFFPSNNFYWNFISHSIKEIKATWNKACFTEPHVAGDERQIAWNPPSQGRLNLTWMVEQRKTWNFRCRRLASLLEGDIYIYIYMVCFILVLPVHHFIRAKMGLPLHVIAYILLACIEPFGPSPHPR